MRQDRPVSRRSAWYKPVSIWRSFAARPRLYAAAGTSVLAFLLLPHQMALSLRGAIAWDLGGLIYLALAFRAMRASEAQDIRSRAARQDESALVILAILALVLLAVFASFAAIAELLTQAKQASSGDKPWLLGLAALTIVVAWLVVQVVFAFHYAHEHYAPNPEAGGEGGLKFPGPEDPNYWDFFYFATSIGAASQTSDTLIQSRVIRHFVTLHAIVAFFFNTMVLALGINLAASLI